jgi:hypothetical protein
MAGVAGFEPTYGGIKTRCLTTWRHPKLISKDRIEPSLVLRPARALRCAVPASRKPGVAVVTTRSPRAANPARSLAACGSPTWRHPKKKIFPSATGRGDAHLTCRGPTRNARLLTPASNPRAPAPPPATHSTPAPQRPATDQAPARQRAPPQWHCQMPRKCRTRCP